RPLPVNQEAQVGKEAGVFMKHAFRITTASRDVPVMVEHPECVAIFEGSRTPLQNGSGRRYIEGIGDCFRLSDGRLAAIIGFCHGVIPGFACWAVSQAAIARFSLFSGRPALAGAPD